MSQNIHGYICVSSHDQNEDRQLIAMREVRVPEKNVYIDKQSGKDFERPQYKTTPLSEMSSSAGGHILPAQQGCNPLQ